MRQNPRIFLLPLLLCSLGIALSVTLASPPAASAEVLKQSTVLPARPVVPPSAPALAAPVAPVAPTPKVTAPTGVTPGQSEERADHDQRIEGVPQEEQIPSTPLGAKELEMQQRGIVRAEVRPARPYVLSLPFAGTLASVEVYDGELVEKDQVLAVLDKQGMERELEEARLVVTAALERVQTVQEYTPKEQEEARENLARSADKLREVEERMAMTSLRAPFAGRVTEIKTRAGQHLKRGEAVMELAEQGDLEVFSQVPSAWVSRLRPGNIIWVYVEETGKSYEAEFVRFGGKVNPSVRSIRAYARFVNTPAELLPGMGGRADFFPPQSR